MGKMRNFSNTSKREAFADVDGVVIIIPITMAVNYHFRKSYANLLLLQLKLL